jgi:putative oxidoreductase
MLKKLVQTDDSIALLFVRLALGIVMFPHGAQKLLGWFGGHGFAGAMQFFSGELKLPAVVGLLVIIAEFFGSLALILGFLGRVGAFGILSVMLGAILLIHGRFGFFMNWYGTQPAEGFEYHLLAIGMALAVMIHGSGSFSVDRSLSDKSTGPRLA